MLTTQSNASQKSDGDQPCNADHKKRQAKGEAWAVTVHEVRNDASNSRPRADPDQAPAQSEEAGSKDQRWIVAMLWGLLVAAVAAQRLAGLPLCIKEGWAADQDATAHHEGQ